MINKRPSGKRRSRRKSNLAERKEEKIYLDGKVTETLPGTRFRVKVERNKSLEPLLIDCQIKTLFKVRKIKIIRGDQVVVEIDPETDIDPEKGITRGVIIQRQDLRKKFDNNLNSTIST